MINSFSEYIENEITKNGLIYELSFKSGEQEEDKKEGVSERILRAPRKNVDWCVLVKTLIKDGFCVADIAKASGYSERKIRDMKRDIVNCEEMDKVVNLMMLFFRNTDKDIPIIGDYYDEKLG